MVRSPQPAVCCQSCNGLDQARRGNFSNVKGVGSGMFEYKIDFGPGYRIYFGKDGERLVIVLGGGAKKRQQHDIAAALANWQDYKRRKQENDHASNS
jgi:putative addiction module killer protein